MRLGMAARAGLLSGAAALVIFLLAAALTLCVGCATPVVPVGPPTPVDPGPSPGPGPIDPGPGPTPVPTTGPGTITDAQFAALPDGSTEAAVLALVGQPYQKHSAAGFSIWAYLMGGRTVWFWMKDGVVDHRSSAP